MNHFRPRYSLASLLAATALVAIPLSMAVRPEPIVLGLEIVIVAVAFAGAIWWRSRGRSALLGGLVAGMAAMLGFETIEMAYHRTLAGLDPSTVARLFNAAAAPLAAAVLGGAVGLAVAVYGWLVERPGPRSARQASMGGDREQPRAMGRQEPEQQGDRDDQAEQDQGSTSHDALGSIA